MRNKQKNLHTITEKAKEEFAGAVLPDPNVVSEKWLSHPETHEMNRMLVKLANSDTIPTASELGKSTEHLIFTELPKGGFRQQIFKVLTLGDVLTGMGKGFAAYPYTPLHKTKGIDPEKIKANLWKGPGGEVVYKRPDPYSPDPNDPHDPMVDPDERVWQLMRGKVIEVQFHKTCSDPQLLWLSQYGVFYFKCYDSIRAKYMKSIGEDPSDTSKPFFINSKGSHFLGNQDSLDMTTFCTRVGIQWMSSHMCRKMMVRTIYNSNNAILKEYEQNALCHHQNTAEDFYLGPMSKSVKSLTVTAWFREQLNLNADMVVNTTEIEECWLTNEQGQRCQEAMAKLTEQELSFWLDAEERKASIIQPTQHKYITPNVKVAIVRLVKEATLKGYIISGKGSPAELLLDGRPVRTPAHTSLILRMLVLLPQEWSSVQALRESLLDYAGLLARDKLPVRKLMVNWATKIVDLFHTMRTKATHIANPIICKELADISIALDGCYLMGNKKLERQLAFWIGLEKKRTARARGEIVVIPPEEIHDKLEKSRKELAAQRAKQGRVSAVDETELSEKFEDNLQESTTVAVNHVEVEVDVDAPINITITRTPQKSTRFSTTWDDELKFQLLSQYIEKCSNPMVPLHPNKKRKAQIEVQCQQLRNEEVEYEGTMKKWKEISSSDTMANQMFRQGFDLQNWRAKREPSRGLHAIIQKVVGDEGTSETVKQKMPEILAMAKEYMS